MWIVFWGKLTAGPFETAVAAAEYGSSNGWTRFELVKMDIMVKPNENQAHPNP